MKGVGILRIGGDGRGNGVIGERHFRERWVQDRWRDRLARGVLDRCRDLSFSVWLVDVQVVDRCNFTLEETSDDGRVGLQVGL